MFRLISGILIATLALMVAVGNGQVSGTTTKVTQGTTPWVTRDTSTWEVGIYTAVNSTQTITGNVAVSSMPNVTVSSLPTNTWEQGIYGRLGSTLTTTVTNTINGVIYDTAGNDLELVKQNDIYNAGNHGIPIFGAADTGAGPDKYIQIRVHNDGTLLTHMTSSSDVLFTPASTEDITALRTALTTSTTVTGQVRINLYDAAGNSTVFGNTASNTIATSLAAVHVRSMNYGRNDTTGYWNYIQTSPTDTGAMEVETGDERTMGKTQVYKVGSVTTTNASENVVTNATYTVTSGKTLFVRSWDCMATLSTLVSSTTYTSFGTASLETPTSTKIKTTRLVGINSVSSYQNVFNPPIPVAAGVNIRITVTPTVGSSKIWDCNFDGFEK